MRSKDLAKLLQEFEDPIICFLNADGYYEPLVGVWSPCALEHLMEHVRKGATGPTRAVKELQGKTIRPTDEYILLNVNIKDEWNRALSKMRTVIK